MPPPESGRFDLALVGGGLQNALIALAVLHRRPQSRILLVERDSALGGNHTWSFHTATVAEDEWPFIEPLVVARWARHRVTFPEHQRDLGTVELEGRGVASPACLHGSNVHRREGLRT